MTSCSLTTTEQESVHGNRCQCMSVHDSVSRYTSTYVITDQHISVHLNRCQYMSIELNTCQHSYYVSIPIHKCQHVSLHSQYNISPLFILPWTLTVSRYCPKPHSPSSSSSFSSSTSSPSFISLNNRPICTKRCIDVMPLRTAVAFQNIKTCETFATLLSPV